MDKRPEHQGNKSEKWEKSWENFKGKRNKKKIKNKQYSRKREPNL